MPDVASVRTADDVRAFLAVPSPDSLSSEQLRTHGPQASLVDPAGARCSVWWRDTPTLEGTAVGVIGHYAATNENAGKNVLGEACARIREHGLNVVIGPMDGTTWRRYRFMTEPGTEPPFFLEPTNHPMWPGHWAQAGFTPLASYVSTLAPRPMAPDPRTAEAAARATSSGITIRTLRTDDFDRELTAVHRLSLRSFAGNFLYTPIAPQEFSRQYEAVRPYLDTRLVLMAEQTGELVGFSFALPDLLEHKRGQPLATAILKTLAVDPALGGQGLGALLTARTLEACWNSGYRRVIGALMHVDNRSRRISEHYAHVMRRYELFSRDLGD